VATRCQAPPATGPRGEVVGATGQPRRY